MAAGFGGENDFPICARTWRERGGLSLLRRERFRGGHNRGRGGDDRGFAIDRWLAAAEVLAQYFARKHHSPGFQFASREYSPARLCVARANHRWMISRQT